MGLGTVHKMKINCQSGREDVLSTINDNFDLKKKKSWNMESEKILIKKKETKSWNYGIREEAYMNSRKIPLEFMCSEKKKTKKNLVHPWE